MLSIIAARSKNNVIGKDNKVPWRLKADRVLLKNLTKGKTVILGRKSYDSMVGYYDRSGATMPAQTYIVITQNQSYAPTRQGAVVVHSIEEATEKADKLGKEVFVIGGARIYELTLPFVDRLYITEIDATIDGDTFFPFFERQDWEEVSREEHFKDDTRAYNYDFVVLDRKK